MRYYARQVGYHLNDKKLLRIDPITLRSTKTPISDAISIELSRYKVGDCVPCRTEEEIFAAFGVSFVLPCERSVFEFYSSGTTQRTTSSAVGDASRYF